LTWELRGYGWRAAPAHQGEASICMGDGMRIPIYAMITVPLLIAGSAFGASQKDRDDCNGSGDQAIAACTEVINDSGESAGDRAVAYYNRGNAHADKGDLDRAVADYSNRAIADYTEAIRLNPKNANHYSYRPGAYEAKGDFDGAIADYTEAIRLDPKNANLYIYRGNAYKARATSTAPSPTTPK